MSRNAILGIAIVLVVIVVGWWLLQSQKDTSTPSSLPTTQPTTETPSSAPAESTGASMEQAGKNLVSATTNGFSPKTITVKAGDGVTWVNDDNAMHTVNSDPHPTHTAYPLLNTVGRLAPEEKKSLKFPDPGTYKYHDHLNPSSTGTVIVQ